MKSTTPAHFKKCMSCRRRLPETCFGLFKGAKDGLNSYCKECRNYKRRQRGTKFDPVENYIYPLTEHNKAMLSQFFKPTVSLLGLSPGKGLIQITFQHTNPIDIGIEIHLEGVKTSKLLMVGSPIDCLDLVEDFLLKNDIRLMLPNDSRINHWLS